MGRSCIYLSSEALALLSPSEHLVYAHLARQAAMEDAKGNWMRFSAKAVAGATGVSSRTIAGARLALQETDAAQFRPGFVRLFYPPWGGWPADMPPRRPAAPNGWVYFVGPSRGLVKIGFTSMTPERRLMGLQTGSPVPLLLLAAMRGSRDDEKRLHHQFRSARQHGEWFERTPEIQALIEAVAERSE